MTLLIEHCTIIDATAQEARLESYVRVEGDTISEVGQGHPTADGATIDLGGAYLLPGLWDVHTHLRSGTWDGAPAQETGPKAFLTQGRNAMDALQAGITAMRVVGIQDWADVAWRDAFADGRFVGPRLFCCGQALRPTAGHSATLGHPLLATGETLDGVDAVVRAVRTNIKNGVDQIKLVTTGGIMGTGDDVMPAAMFLREEVEAAVRISSQRGLSVAAHATSPEPVEWAVRAGAHSIEHGYILDEQTVDLMSQSGVYYVPTLALSHLTVDQASTPYEKSYCQRNPLPDPFRERANRYAPGHEDSLRLAIDAGVKIACGSDQGPPRDAALLEIELLARCGLGAHGAIVAATRNAAEVCGAGDRLGTVQPGKLADLIVVKDDPLEDIHNLRGLLMVIKDGRVVVDNR